MSAKRVCRGCGGKGRIYQTKRRPEGMVCRTCGGKGTVGKSKPAPKRA